MTISDQVNGFFILPSVRSSPDIPRDAAIKVTLVKNSISPILKEVVAVIDTGAQSSAIDEDMATDNNLDFVRDTVVMSALGFSRTAKIYKCGIFIEEFKQLINTECGALPF